MNNVEHSGGHEHVKLHDVIKNPSVLEGKTAAQIEEMLSADGYTHINAVDAARTNTDVPLSAFVRTHDRKIVHIGIQGAKQYWFNVIVQDVDSPTALEKRMLGLHTNVYRDIGKVKEGTEFAEYAAQNLTGVVREQRAGVVQSIRGIFGSAA